MSSTTEQTSICTSNQNDCACGDTPQNTATSQDLPSTIGAISVVYRIANMDCPTEETLIRQKLTSVEGITQLKFNLLERKLTVEHRLADEKPIQRALQEIGMQAELVDTATQAQQHRSTSPTSSKSWWLIGLGVASAIAAEVIAWVSGNESSWAVIALSLFAILISGVGTYKKDGSRSPISI